MVAWRGAGAAQAARGAARHGSVVQYGGVGKRKDGQGEVREGEGERWRQMRESVRGRRRRGAARQRSSPRHAERAHPGLLIRRFARPCRLRAHARRAQRHAHATPSPSFRVLRRALPCVRDSTDMRCLRSCAISAQIRPREARAAQRDASRRLQEAVDMRRARRARMPREGGYAS